MVSSRGFYVTTSDTHYSEYANCSKIWTQKDRQYLRYLFLNKVTLRSICDDMQRPPVAVIPKLIAEGLIAIKDNNYYWTKNALDAAIWSSATELTTTSTEEIEMNRDSIKNIETRVFIGGVDATTMSDTKIFELIINLEGQIEKWKGVGIRPKKLQSVIDQLTKDIQALVDYVDAR